MKVVYFDYWTKGIHNFKLIDISLKSEGHETMLLHIGSFRYPKSKREETINGILCRDVRYYKTIFLFKALRRIKPDLVIGLNTTYIMDRALVMACRRIGIRAVFMMHGDRAIDDEIEQVINSLSYNFFDKMSKAKKYFFLVVPNYVFSTWKYSKNRLLKLIPFKVLLNTFNQPAISNYFPIHPEEITFDKCLIYANKYKEYYHNLGYRENQIAVTGNPKNDLFFELVNNKFPTEGIIDNSIRKLISSGQKYALYLDDSYQEQGINGWSYDYFNDHILEISQRLHLDNLKLVVKTHPTTDFLKVNKNNPNIIFTNTDLEYLIYYSTFCIAHTSSTVNLAILIKKPVFIPQWGKSKGLPDIYCKHGVAKKWNNLKDKLDLRINANAYNKFIDENITVTGPFSNQLILKELF